MSCKPKQNFYIYIYIYMLSPSQVLGWSSGKSFWFKVIRGYSGLTFYKECRKFVSNPGDFFTEIFG
jgi:hypothetical protein